MANKNRAVFLDRDGTLAKDVPYCARPDDFELLPGAGEGIGLLNGAGFKVIVITNQSGIARGHFDEEMLEKIHQKMKADLAKCGAHIDAVYYCPHHPDDGCECRKPRPGLLLQAARELSIDLASSYMIGDSAADIIAGATAGCRTVLLRCGSAPSVVPTCIAASLREAVEWVCADFAFRCRLKSGDSGEGTCRQKTCAANLKDATLEEDK